MSAVDEFPMPRRAQLMAADPAGFKLQVGPGEHIAVELVDLRDGLGMSDEYECFAAIFALPQGVRLPQAVFRLTASDACQWLVLMTPMMPLRDGRHALQMVIHALRTAHP
ncbi:DUF6916 family protein [Pseudomonas juntendi]|uniref:DUF6916 family protein n=1 Tax=Pseudomonas juntendi TaxID=2666183 RepID=UPI001F17C15A|nr:hypothetical protein [Pseudomonas juntendi]